MSEKSAQETEFLRWAQDERIRMPTETIEAIHRVIKEFVDAVTVRNAAFGDEMKAVLYETAKMSVGCVDPLRAVKEECVQEQQRYFALLNETEEQSEDNQSRSRRKPIRGAKRRPDEYR